MNEANTFNGYTIEQIRELDNWKKKYDINPDLIGSAYKDGFEYGREVTIKQYEEIFKEQMERMK